MRLSTSTNIHQMFGSNIYCFDVCESIEKCAAAGYRVIEINFGTSLLDCHPLSKPMWKDWVLSVKTQLEKCNMEASQSHALIFKRAGLSKEVTAWYDEILLRCLEASSILGVKWVVLHPLHGKDMEGRTHKQIVEENACYFRPLGKMAERFGVGIAIENMFTGCFQSARDLLDLLDCLDSPVFGACWDTGHANLTGQNQRESIMLLGHRLKALNINDNYGLRDDHLPPSLGNVSWDDVVEALKEAGYQGDFTFEIHKFTQNLSVEARDKVFCFIKDLGDILIK